jgi:hypothetical protein
MAKRTRRPELEALEGRQLLTGILALTGAGTSDSQSVTVSYEVRGGDLTGPVELGVFRSDNPTYEPGQDVAVGAVALDAAAGTDLAVGAHTATMAVPGGLPAMPSRPYVLVVANPSGAVTTADTVAADQGVASFRKHTIAVVTHGGMQLKSDNRGPFWQKRMTAELLSQGYDTAIAFNWAAASRTPGSMQGQAPRLADQIAEAAAAFPAGDPVDLHLIGHSEGAVLNSLALTRLAPTESAELHAGFTQITMLDPHSANTAVKGQQYSTSGGILGQIAKNTINTYQARADDPPAFVPINADAADVYFQRTKASEAQAGHQGWYNLWGQVPVIGDATYYDLTGPGVSHSGKFAVYDWYQLMVVPTLGVGAPVMTDAAVTGALVTPPREGLTDRGIVHVADRHVRFAGEAAPGAHVRVLAARPQGTLVTVGRAKADAHGDWVVTTRPLPTGTYRVLARSDVPHGPFGRPVHAHPVAWIGQVAVDRIPRTRPS